MQVSWSPCWCPPGRLHRLAGCRWLAARQQIARHAATAATGSQLSQPLQRTHTKQPRALIMQPLQGVDEHIQIMVLMIVTCKDNCRCLGIALQRVNQSRHDHGVKVEVRHYLLPCFCTRRHCTHVLAVV